MGVLELQLSDIFSVISELSPNMSAHFSATSRLCRSHLSVKKRVISKLTVEVLASSQLLVKLTQFRPSIIKIIK